MTWVAAAVVGSAVVGAYASNKASQAQSKAAKQAAQVSADAAESSNALQREMWQNQVGLQTPWWEAGKRALPQLEAQANAMPAAFTGQVDLGADPGYQFRLSEGLKALDRQAAARGGLISGSALKAAGRYGQEAASQEYQNAYQRALTAYNANVAREGAGYNRLSNLAGVGQTAAGTIGQAGQQYANQFGQNMQGAAADRGNALLAAGNARASGYTGAASALGNALGMYRGFGGFGGGATGGQLATTPTAPAGYDWGVMATPYR